MRPETPAFVRLIEKRRGIHGRNRSHMRPRAAIISNRTRTIAGRGYTSLKMKLLASQLLFALLAATTLAAPITGQVPLAGMKHEMQDVKSTSAGFGTPFVVKAPSSAPTVTLAPTGNSKHSGVEKHSCWNLFWDWPCSKKEKPAALSCFCAGGAICCHTLDGLGCDYGMCGV